MTSAPNVVALVGSPRRYGNTVHAVGVATQELERRGARCQTVLLCDLPIDLSDREPKRQTRKSAEAELESHLDRVWAADGLILATPVYFANVSAQMKAFMDITNDRYMAQQFLVPRVIGLMAIGGQGGFNATIEAMRRYLALVAPSQPPVVVATGHADSVGEAERSQEVHEAALTMAGQMADILLT